MSKSSKRKEIVDRSYNDDQIVVVKDDIADLKNTGPFKMSGEKSFICSFFHEYIKDNIVRVRDVYTMFKDINSDLHLKDIDVLSFLLRTNKFEVLSSNKLETVASCTSEEMLPETVPATNVSSISVSQQETPASIDDVYDSLVNDEVHDGKPIKSKPIIEDAKASHTSSEERTKLEVTEEPVGKDNIQKMVEKILHLEDQIKNKDTVISLFDNERGALLKKLGMYDTLSNQLEDLQIRYNILEEENHHIKEEISDLKFSKRKLEMMKGVHSQTKGIDIMKNFQNEYKILKDSIHAEYEQKFEKKVKELREKIDLVEKPKMTQLFNDVLKHLFLNNRSIIVGQYDKTVLAVEVLDTINSWFEEIMCSKNFIDTSKWQCRLRILERIMNEYDNQYEWLLEQDTKSIVQLELPHIPDPPPEKLGDTIKNAFAAFYMNQCQVLDAALNATPEKKVNSPINTSVLVDQIKDCWENHRVPWIPVPTKNGPTSDEIIPELSEQSRFELQDEARALPEYAVKNEICNDAPSPTRDIRESSTPPPDCTPGPDMCWNCWSTDHATQDCDQRRRTFCRGCGLTGWSRNECVNCNTPCIGAKPKKTHRGNRNRRSSRP